MSAKTVRLSRETVALVEHFRESLFQSEDEILHAALTRLERNDRSAGRKSAAVLDEEIGCDLGQGAVLANGEAMYLFRYRASLESGKFEGIAMARDGKLFIGEMEIRPSRGSLVQPALQMVQRRLNDISQTRGGYVVLDAWEYWYVKRDGRFLRVGDLRNPEKIQRRHRRRRSLSERDLFPAGESP
ncbi:MAG: hypothetical protein ISR47_10060 [Rhodospirillales bacterium]|nr:hypothetical protein [Rhodospirillales bacterium]